MSKNRLIEASMYTDQGQVRDHNEDFIISCEPQSKADENDHGWLFIVADGVGGADAGEVASEYACDRTIEHYIANPFKATLGDRLRDAMLLANTDLRKFVVGRDGGSRMATTMVAIVIQDDQAHITNVGDSRCYLWRKGEFRQITKDHSLVAKLVEEGAITKEEARNHPRKNVILYSLGSEREPQIDIFPLKVQQGDRFLLCSDGLTLHVPDDELADIVANQPPEKATHTLVGMANERGGKDNISATVVQYNGRRSPTSHAAPKKQEKRPGREMGIYVIGLVFALILLIVFAWFIFGQTLSN